MLQIIASKLASLGVIFVTNTLQIITANKLALVFG